MNWNDLKDMMATLTEEQMSDPVLIYVRSENLFTTPRYNKFSVIEEEDDEGLMRGQVYLVA